jgi:excisionase family DNA binding protein
MTMNRLAYSVKEAGAALGVSARTIVREVQRGRLRAARVGRRVLIPAEALTEFLNRRVPISAPGQEHVEQSCGVTQ